MNLIKGLGKFPVVCAEGYLFARKGRGYLKAGAFISEAVLGHLELVSHLHIPYKYYPYMSKHAMHSTDKSLKKVYTDAAKAY